LKNQPQRENHMKTLIIIPTYNEIENLPSLLRGIFASAPETDVLVVDDNSPDGTGQLIEAMCEQDSRMHIIHRPGKLGLGTAYIAGFKYAIAHQYDAAFEMDADFSHDPRHLPDFLVAIKSADLVIGSRYIPGGGTPNWSPGRRLISGSGNIFARFVLQLPVQDCTGGFRCYRRHVLEAIDLDSVRSRGYAFQVEMTYRVLNKGFAVVETPIIFVDRRLGQSKMSRSIVLEAFTYVLKTRFSSAFLHNKPSRSAYRHQILLPLDAVEPLAERQHISTLPDEGDREREENLVRADVKSSSHPMQRF
jgi:dolichol-phosphate mannosyltransferase